MTDHELLKAAAKAVGLKLIWGEKYKLGDDLIDCSDMLYVSSEETDCADVHWDPLTDDGDALRLAVKLGLAVHQIDTFVNVSRVSSDDGDEFIDIFEDYNDDPYAATRRAIVRAAAAVGAGK